jgi:hypothetical protein
MVRKFDTAESEETGPEDLVIRAFSRCSNYPKERAGVLGLAQGLRASADKFGVSMSAIIAECVSTSSFCPTDHDLLEVARALRPADKQEKHDRCRFGLCDGSGWREGFYLHTIHQGDEHKNTWIEKTLIESRTLFDELARKVDWKTQMVYEGRYRCRCHPPREGEDDKRFPTRRKGAAGLSKADVRDVGAA